MNVFFKDIKGECILSLQMEPHQHFHSVAFTSGYKMCLLSSAHFTSYHSTTVKKIGLHGLCMELSYSSILFPIGQYHRKTSIIVDL